MASGPFSSRICAFAEAGRAIRVLRESCFPEANPSVLCDAFDDRASHLLIERNNSLFAACRLDLWSSGKSAAEGYAGAHYDLTPFEGIPGPMLEIGRLCVDPEQKHPDLLRLLLAGLTSMALKHRVSHLFGCTSFAGLDPGRYESAFRYLAENHPAPPGLCPLPGARRVLPLTGLKGSNPVDAGTALRQMPALLRSYLSLNAWVCDHIVVDPDMRTLHILTCVEVSKIPENRARALRETITI